MDSKWKECVFKSVGCGEHFLSKDCKVRPFGQLNANTSNHFKSLHLRAPDITESTLVQNRIGVKFNENEKICPQHRFANGINWHPPKSCKHPNHLTKKKSHAGIRSVDLKLAENIKQQYDIHFPVGFTICAYCRTTKIKLPETSDSMTEMETEDNIEDVDFPDPEANNNLKTIFNTVIKLMPNMEAKCSPLKYQLNTPLSKISNNTIQSLKTKFNHYVSVFSQELASIMCPGQGEEFLSVIATMPEQESEEVFNDEMIAALKNVTNKNVKTMMISTVAQKYSIRSLIKIFGCSFGVAQLAKKIANSDQTAIESIYNPTDITRGRLDIEKVKHFIDFMFSTGFIQDVAYGTTKITMSNGKVFEIPHAVRTLLRSQIILAYQNYCTSIEIPYLSRSSLWRVFECCKASQQKAMQCLDSYVAEGVIGFEHLKTALDSCNVNTTDLFEVSKPKLNFFRFLLCSFCANVRLCDCIFLRFV
jgi:hypothetical protein